MWLMKLCWLGLRTCCVSTGAGLGRTAGGVGHRRWRQAQPSCLPAAPELDHSHGATGENREYQHTSLSLKYLTTTSLYLKQQAYTGIAYVPIVQDGFQLMSGFVRYQQPCSQTLPSSPSLEIQWSWFNTASNGNLTELYMYCDDQVMETTVTCKQISRVAGPI